MSDTQDSYDLTPSGTPQEEPLPADPEALDILNQDLSSYDRITKLVNLYHQDHPREVPEVELDHPSFSPTHNPCKKWLLIQYDYDVLRFWTDIIESVKTWFPPPVTMTKAVHAFCMGVELESSCFYWHERIEFHGIWEQYLDWKKTIKKGGDMRCIK